VDNGDDKKAYIDVMEKVFGGVRISPDDEPRPDVSRSDLRSRPWLTGVTMSSVQVTLAEENEKDDEEHNR